MAGCMDFYSAYRHGFVRVAACTIHTALADPAANAASVEITKLNALLQTMIATANDVAVTGVNIQQWRINSGVR